MFQLLGKLWKRFFFSNNNINLLSGNAGYCFVDFASNGAAMKHLTTVNGTMIPGTTRFFKLNWASGGGG